MPISKPTLIPEWRSAWRFLSVNLAALGAAMAGAWLLTPPETQAAVLAFLGIKPGAAAFVLFLAIVFGRVFKFTPADPAAFQPTRPAEPQTEEDLANLPVEK